LVTGRSAGRVFRLVLGCSGEAQIAEERSDEGGGLRFGRGGPR